APIIIRLFNDNLASLLKPGGNMVLAGILSPQVPAVMAAANKAGLNLVEQLEYDDWVALIIKC
ncbi:MAG: 50S ribosomal protein L11 methyltransferase, partial [Chloroflexota bacterium]